MRLQLGLQSPLQKSNNVALALQHNKYDDINNMIHIFRFLLNNSYFA
jgi:hypothetical protein